MDTMTGFIYQSFDAALTAGVPPERMVQIEGTPEAIESVSRAVSAAYRAERKARNKAAKASRRKNRGK